MSVDFSKIHSSCFVLDESLLRKNLELIASVQQKAGVQILLAFKGFAMWSVFPIIQEYHIKGATASSLNEAILCNEEMNVKAHTYSPAYLPSEFSEIMDLSSHITFNSIAQFEKYQSFIASHPLNISCGLRVNPEYSEVETKLYDPCAPGSRLGVLSEQLEKSGLPKGIEGFHFHNLCESSSFSLEKTLKSFEEKFGKWLPQLKWVNMGGGHLMTNKNYDVPHLIQVLQNFKRKHQLEVILEPGSAFAWNTGFLVSHVLDIFENKGIKTAIVDVSFTAHMPDVLEMPYRPKIIGATEAEKDKPTYRIGGVSCLAGDYISEYSFDKDLKVGDQIIFEDMIHYTMVKTTMFNGVKHPDIAIWTKNDELKILRSFNYEDFKNRLS